MRYHGKQHDYSTMLSNTAHFPLQENWLVTKQKAFPLCLDLCSESDRRDLQQPFVFLFVSLHGQRITVKVHLRYFVECIGLHRAQV